VSWANMKTVAPYQTSTVLSPPVGAYDPGSGHVAVKVHDRNGAPIAGVPVQVVGGTVNESLTTTDAYSTSPGCAFFGYLPAGTYTVRLGTAGYVDNQGNASPTQSVGVNAGQIASVAFDYDLAGTLDLDLVGINGGTPATTMAVTLANNGYVPSGLKAFSGTGSSRVLGDLFPFPSGYAAFAGDCADADPEGQASMTGPAYWPGASRPDPFEIDPGAATTGTVPLATVQLNFSRTSGSTNLTINAVHAADWKCNGGETLPVASVTTSTSTLVALPYGTWTLKINGKSPVGSWPVVMLDPRSTTTVPANVSI